MKFRRVLLLPPLLLVGAMLAGAQDCTSIGAWSNDFAMPADSLRVDLRRRAGSDTSCGAVLYGIGRLAYQTERYEVAARAFRSATTVWPESAKVWDELGLALLRTGDHAGCETALWRALRLAPRQREYYNHLGLTLLRQERYAEAAASYIAALGLDPSYVEARYNLGQVYDRQGSSEVALREFRRALGDDPAFIPVRYALAILLGRMKQYDEAVAHLDTAIALDSEFLGAYVERGFIAARRDDYEGATRDFRHVLAADPNHARARYGLGVTLALQRQWVAAQEQCDSLTALDSLLAARLQRLITR